MVEMIDGITTPRQLQCSNREKNNLPEISEEVNSLLASRILISNTTQELEKLIQQYRELSFVTEFDTTHLLANTFNLAVLLIRDSGFTPCIDLLSPQNFQEACLEDLEKQSMEMRMKLDEANAAVDSYYQKQVKGK